MGIKQKPHTRSDSFKMADNEEHVQKCAVCCNAVGIGTAHKCTNCKNYVHLFCGKGIGEEGYGQSVVCFHCGEKEKGSYVLVF